jgi:hypothetical protein
VQAKNLTTDYTTIFWKINSPSFPVTFFLLRRLMFVLSARLDTISRQAQINDGESMVNPKEQQHSFSVIEKNRCGSDAGPAMEPEMTRGNTTVSSASLVQTSDCKIVKTRRNKKC